MTSVDDAKVRKVNAAGIEREKEAGEGELDFSQLNPFSGGGFQQSKEKRNCINSRMGRWLFGLFVSFLPIVIGTLPAVLLGESVKNIIQDILTDKALIYIGVTLSVTAMGDLEPSNRKWLFIYGGEVMASLMCFGVLNAFEKLSELRGIEIAPSTMTWTMVLDIIFLAVPIALGIIQYTHIKATNKHKIK